MNCKIPATALGLVALASLAGAQTYDTIAFESFDYAAGSIDNQTGGSGWFNSWWANGTNQGSGNPSSCDTVLPGMDGIGGMGTDMFENTGSYRVPESGPWPDITENFQFGKDGAEIWVSFLCRRSVGSDDGYGGLSLQLQGVGEVLYLGSPFGTGEWGYGDPAGGTGGSVAGSNVDQVTQLVYKIEFMAGPEQLSLWIDPASAHPTTTPDLTAAISDFRWNEIRLQSGVFTTGHGYDFDAISIETPRLFPGTAYCSGDGSATACPCGNDNDGSNGPAGCANGTSAGGATLSGTGDASVAADTVVLTASGLPTGQPGLFFRGDSALGAGAGVTFGDGLRCAGGSVVRLEVAFSGASGTISSSTAMGASLVGGDVMRYQVWYRDPAGSPCSTSFNLTNGYEIDWLP